MSSSYCVNVLQAERERVREREAERESERDEGSLIM